MANNYQEYNDYLKKMQDQMLSKAETIEYNPQSASTLKSALAKALRPDVDRAIQSRQKTAAQNRAAIDADAAARGMGSSTWVTDVKNRQNDAAASDISNLESDYISTLYGNLLNRMGAQEQNKLSVDQFNASQRQAALDRAQAATDQWWQTWKKKNVVYVDPMEEFRKKMQGQLLGSVTLSPTVLNKVDTSTGVGGIYLPSYLGRK